MPFRPMNLRGKRVLARCAADGSFIDEGGRVEIRYSPRDGKAYHASLRNLEAIPGDTALLPDDHCAALLPSAPSAPGAAKKPAAATRTPAKRATASSGAPPQGTNNIGELTGVLRACEQTPDKSRPLRIYTDSTYSIGVLQQGWKAKANQELVAACKAAMARIATVSLHYVKGHAGVPLNEAADVLAVTAVERRRSTPWVKVSG
ncbi:MAG: ribonuclease HI [Sandaracinaceae bacterium]|nr:ribonuclease HI [Sandaracinaceae bacterium]